MGRRKQFSLRAVILAGFLATSLGVPLTHAATQSTSVGNAIKVAPVRTDLTIPAGESRRISITLQNLTSTSVEYEAIINDFVASSGESGQPALILDANKYAPSHSLKRYITPVPNVTVGGGESKDVTVSVAIPNDAAAGGYYGAVRFAPAGSVDPTKNVTLSASVGSLILVKVPGDIKENMTLESFDVRTSPEATSGSSFFTSNKDLYAVSRFKNTGNVHEQPFGKVVLKRGSKVLQTIEINNTDPRGNVLPDSIRRFSVKLDKVGLWGKYTVEGNFGYGSSGQLVSGSTSFYVFPLAYVLVALAVLAVIVLAVLGLPRAIKRYNQNVIRRASRRK
jgi:hypothetical protein